MRTKRREACIWVVVVVLEQGVEVHIIRQGNPRQGTCSAYELLLVSCSGRSRKWEARLVEVDHTTDLVALVHRAVGISEGRQHRQKREIGEGHPRPETLSLSSRGRGW